MTSESAEVDAKIQSYQPAHQALARHLRIMIHEEIPGVEEGVAWGKSSFSLQGTRVLYFSSAKSHFNLGLYEGASLDDPAGIVEGTRKKMRHVKLRDIDGIDGIDEEALRALIQAAAAQAQAA